MLVYFWSEILKEQFYAQSRVNVLREGMCTGDEQCPIRYPGLSASAALAVAASSLNRNIVIYIQDFALGFCNCISADLALNHALLYPYPPPFPYHY